ncbi:MAG TPA: hypothetical protein VGJ72_05050 [Polaromonas sp.]|jgi:hypothetical protein
MNIVRPALIFVLALLGATGHAQTMYRCGNTFSERPCGPDAKVLVQGPAKEQPLVALPDTPPSADVIEANKLACASAVRNAMKDPEAARIGTVTRSGPGVDYFQMRTFQVVIYFVNANGKNSYGGYTGEKLHMCSFDPSEKTIIRTRELGPAVK